ncbi:hypothetical protein [Tardiphaga sp.]|jgi:hypothetical protein|uniref:hypothetical protein n=1 Tax=Tardiphaga sp. TaxID=1926292 RepID=UPI0037DA6665
MEHAGLIISAIGLLVALIGTLCGAVWWLATQLWAQKEKTYQVEIWARDEFVSKDSFGLVVGRVEKSIADFRGEFAGRLEKISDKIDRIAA